MEVVFEYVEFDRKSERRNSIAKDRVFEYPHMAVHCAYPYMRIDIMVFPIALNKNDREDLRRCIVHELCHVMNWKLRHFRKAPQKIYNDIDEETAERMMMAFLNIADTVPKLPKKHV